MASSPGLRWGLITGESPPAPGGVGAYTIKLAQALAAAGDEVHVWAPAPVAPVPGVTLHALAGGYGGRGRRQLSADLRDCGQDLRLLLQYVPHAYGCKGMNLGLARWAARQRHRQFWVMYHEVAYLRQPGQDLRHWLLGAVTQRMAVQLRCGAARSFVSIPAWEAWLAQLAPGSRAGEVLPVFSNLPESASPAALAAERQRYGRGGALIGTFSAFSAFAQTTLAPVLASLLAADASRSCLLIGKGSEAAAAAIVAAVPALAARIHATGPAPPQRLAAAIAACDLLIQAYGDGITGRRGSAMASLALGRPLLTHAGDNTEPVWTTTPDLAQERASSPEALGRRLHSVAEDLLRDDARRAALGAAGLRLYQAHFALDHTVKRLRQA